MLAEPLSPAPRTLFRADDRPVEWAVSKGHVDYAAAEAFMEARVAAIAAGEACGGSVLPMLLRGAVVSLLRRMPPPCTLPTRSPAPRTRS